MGWGGGWWWLTIVVGRLEWRASYSVPTSMERGGKGRMKVIDKDPCEPLHLAYLAVIVINMLCT